MTASRPTGRAALAFLILLASCAAIAAPKAARRPAAALPRHGVVVFSDLCVSADSGEFGGQRITLQRYAEVDTVVYEYTAGGLSWPLVAGEVTVDPRGRQFYFTVQLPEGEERTVNGRLSADGRALVLDGGYCADQSVPMRLARVADFGRKAGPCHRCPPGKAGKGEGQGEGQGEGGGEPAAAPAPAHPLDAGSLPTPQG
ncbi:hypothetical protein [Rugamonas rubra]|uniref:Lipoprotein n=1 Tax=Rugamonas rubra TaxID=758825 RepID=A0A1I4N2F4_9BURK|nr:hypothetical protein [Rugamonas rubra]SFM09699.1 hypothetical protein SAMN02982985_02727 [Rugamonas rubra]